MANGNGDKKALFDKLVSEGADPTEAAKFAGIEPPKSPKAGGNAKAAKAAKATTKPDRPTKSVSVPKVKMNPTSAQKVIFGIMVGVTALTIFGDVANGKARAFDTIPRRMIGGSIAGIMLMIFATFAPRLAVAFAVLAGSGALFLSEGGKSTIDAITKLAGGDVRNTTGSGSGNIPPANTPGQPS